MIETRALTVVYGRTVALDGIDLSIGEGITGLFGQNGSGKSTLLRVLAGLLRPRSGMVTIGDAPLDLRDERFRRRLGYAGHDSGLYPHLTVGENLDLFSSLYGCPEDATDTILERVRLADRKDARAGELSAGLKRRAAVARALLHDPDILLLDEPYANLDDDGAAAITAAIESWRGPGKTGIVATHGAKRVKAYADAGVILTRGTVTVAGSYRPGGKRGLDG
ncbi:MAG: heme ABC exporter ATP-binding protein CcmA [Actinobacteria bacterium]|nr:heme ABC exporter ATP-binding protein CcmA [Actinomycetota bacterium]